LLAEDFIWSAEHNNEFVFDPDNFPKAGDESFRKTPLGSWTWSEEWGEKKLKYYCELVRGATAGHWDEAGRQVFKFGKWCGGGAYDPDDALKELMKAAKENITAPPDYSLDHPKKGKIKCAFLNGVQEPEDPPTDARVEVLPESQWFGEKPAPIPPALIKGIFPQTGVATIGGQSGTGKSFHAIHLGVRLIPDCQQNFYIDKYRIKRHGGVVYLVLEGKPAFPLRLTAAFEQAFNKELEFGDRFKLPFAWNSYAPNLFDKGPDNLLRLVEREAKKMREEFSVELTAIFLDTMGLAACFENENMAAQVQRVVSGLSRVSDETGALCINVDHMGKDQDAGIRGTSAKRDCVETILTCFCDRENGDKPTNHRMQLFKVRDGEEGRIIPYRLEQVDMGVDEDREQLTTAVVRWEPERKVKGRKKQQKKQTDVVLELAIRDVGGVPVGMEKLREAFYHRHGGSNHAANTAWHRAIRGLEPGVFEDGNGRF
jgi:AAA domain